MVLFVFQEAAQQLVVEMDILLTLEQYQKAVPETLVHMEHILPSRP